MASIIRIADRLTKLKARTEGRTGLSAEQRLRYPRPDVLAEISCHALPKRSRQASGGASGRRTN